MLECRNISKIYKTGDSPAIETIAVKNASFEILAKVNADNILMNDFLSTIQQIQKIKLNSFLIVGQRWDLDIKELIQFEDPDWQEKLREVLSKEGKLHGLSGMDYWIFSRNIQFNTPPFTEGRFATDGWLVYKAKTFKIPIIDATEVINIIHQNHYYPQKKKSFYEIERKRNIKLAGGYSRILTLRDADWILTSQGLKRPGFPRRIFAELSLFFPWRFLLSIKRNLQQLK